MRYNKQLYQSIKEDYEQGLTVKQITEKYKIRNAVVERSLSGIVGKGIGKSEKYILRPNRFIKDDTQRQIIADYQNGKDIPEILTKYDITRERLLSLRTKFKIEDRNCKRANISKSITVELNGQLKTYPSIEQCFQQTGIPSDFLNKLKNNQTFGLSKWSETNFCIVHDLDRINKLERASELMGLILHQGSTRDKIEYGVELKQLIFQLGYADELKLEIQ